jgi:hypothetical protein
VILHKNEVYYLGVEDKNGKELNSNCTIKFKNYVGLVFYSVEDCRFKIKWEDGSTRGLNKSFMKQVEII